MIVEISPTFIERLNCKDDYISSVDSEKELKEDYSKASNAQLIARSVTIRLKSEVVLGDNIKL